MFTAFTERSLNMELPSGFDCRWIRGVGWCAAKAHNDMFQKALDWSADLICVVGPDQVHPVGLLPKLMQRIDQGCDVISALVPTREQFEGDGAFERKAWRGQPPERIDPADGILQKIDFIGSGVLMFPAALLEKVKRPWLYETQTDDDFSRRGDCDTNFVWRLHQEGGAQVWVDTTIPVLHATVFEISPTFVSDINAQAAPKG